MPRRKNQFWLLKYVLAGALLLSIGFCSFAADLYRNVDRQQKVYDYADLLTDQEEEILRAACLDIVNANDYDIFLLTIDENNLSYQSEDKTLSFVEDFGDENGFGLGDDQDYVAFIIDMDERSYTIDVAGERCLRIFSNEIQESIKDTVWNFMRDGKYYDTLHYFLEEVEACGSKEVSGFVGSQEEWQKQQQPDTVLDILKAAAGALVLALIVGGSLTAYATGRHKTVHRAIDANPYSDATSFKITKSEEKFLRHYATTRVIETSSGSHSSSGRSSHHTTTHRSSGGRSHGGGSSRKF